MKQPKITVLITVKNSVRTMKECIDSVLDQNYKNYDVIVVDAFSDDGTYEILKSYGRKIKLYQVKGWAPKAFNFAIDKIKSEYTAFTDADCIVDKNWLRELIKGFKSEEILATAGFCGTKHANTALQKAIGHELEERFRRFSKYILRAPTMNLCVRTDVLKKLKFNERFKVAFETDFGYRLNDLGKIYYNKKAIVYHNHRANWKDFFKQQKAYGEYTLMISMLHKKRMFGDHITNPYMLAQVPTFWLLVFFSFLSLFDFRMIFLVTILTVLMLSVFLIKIYKLRVKPRDIPVFLAFFSVRMFAWSLGLIDGIINGFKLKFS